MFEDLNALLHLLIGYPKGPDSTSGYLMITKVEDDD
jgi:hypothetical protein